MSGGIAGWPLRAGTSAGRYRRDVARAAWMRNPVEWELHVIEQDSPAALGWLLGRALYRLPGTGSPANISGTGPLSKPAHKS